MKLINLNNVRATHHFDLMERFMVNFCYVDIYNYYKIEQKQSIPIEYNDYKKHFAAICYMSSFIENIGQNIIYNKLVEEINEK
jgi:hypothetical protein